jgi:hypothetical protein
MPSPKKIEERIVAALQKRGQNAREQQPAIPKPAVKPSPLVASIPKAAPIAINVGAPKLANAGHDIAKAVKGAGNKVKGVGDRIAQRLHDRKVEKEQAKYDQLIVHARGLGITVDDAWSLARLEAEVAAVEDARWKRRYNAQCPYCHHPQRVRASGKFERFGCNNCHNIFSGATARGLGTPPRPQQSRGWRLPF